MHRKILAVVLVASGIGLVGSAVAGIASAGAAQAQRPVVVTATCPPNEQGPLNVTVNPWTVALNQGDNTRWQLNINNSANNRIVIDAKPNSGWPYPSRQVSGQGSAEASNMNANAQGSYNYNITIYCGDDAVVIDPRMRVGGG